MYTKSPPKPQLKTLARQPAEGVECSFEGSTISKM
jgi:hypothetical protein